MREPFKERTIKIESDPYYAKRPVYYQTQTYPINWRDGVLIVGEKTPLELIVTPSVVQFIANCPYFEALVLKSYIEHEGKEYEVVYSIRKNRFVHSFAYLQVAVTTKKEFRYEFQKL